MAVVQKWELTRAALDGLLARLDADPAVAGEKYEHLRRALLKFFRWHGTLEPDSSVDETLDRVARRLQAGHAVEDVPAFAYGVARLVRLERQREAAARPDSLDVAALSTLRAREPAEQDVREACLDECLDELSREDRHLIVAYYVGAGRERIAGRSNLATALGLSENALRLRAQRLRDRLRGCAARCAGTEKRRDDSLAT